MWVIIQLLLFYQHYRIIRAFSQYHKYKVQEEEEEEQNSTGKLLDYPNFPAPK